MAEKGSWTARLFHRADWRSRRAGAIVAALPRGGTLCAVDEVPAASCVQALRRATQVGTLRHLRHLRGYAGLAGSGGNAVLGAAREGSPDATRQAGRGRTASGWRHFVLAGCSIAGIHARVAGPYGRGIWRCRLRPGVIQM